VHGLLFLRWDRSNGALQDWDLFFPNVDALHVRRVQDTRACMLHGRGKQYCYPLSLSLSLVICKNHNIPKSYNKVSTSVERGREENLCIFEKKRKDKERTNWKGEGQSWIRWRSALLDFPDGAMARVYERCWWMMCSYK
jgi:hypothetical protein